VDGLTKSMSDCTVELAASPPPDDWTTSARRSWNDVSVSSRSIWRSACSRMKGRSWRLRIVG
jgi:hypothetical protein